jgi:hypothetical protein
LVTIKNFGQQLSMVISGNRFPSGAWALERETSGYPVPEHVA